MHAEDGVEICGNPEFIDTQIIINGKLVCDNPRYICKLIHYDALMK